MSSTVKLLSFVEGSSHEVVDDAQLPYEVLGNLGFGSSAIVEKVQDKTTAEVFARKTLRRRGRHPDSAVNKNLEKLFQNEVDIARRLRHHHVVKIFATYTSKREFALLLQPVADELDLARYLENVFDLQAASSKDFEKSDLIERTDSMLETLDRAFGCLATGLAFIHRQRVRHKDIKSSNILVHHGQVFYSDFGYSLDCENLGCDTTEGMPASLTRKYSAPEVLEHEKRNASSDVFSLGCVFLDILSVRLQSPGLSPHKGLFSDHLEELRGQLRSLGTTLVPLSLTDIVRDMISPDPEHRPAAQKVSDNLLRETRLSCDKCAAGNAASPTTTQRTFSNSPQVLDFSDKATALAHGWTWSEGRQDYYRINDENSERVREWAKSNQTPAASLDVGKTLQPSGSLRVENGRLLGTPGAWIWSSDYRRYYREVYDLTTGGYGYGWAEPQGSAIASPVGGAEIGQGHSTEATSRKRTEAKGVDPNMAPAASERIRSHLRFQGTPDRGWYETLDPRYRVRTRGESHEFFRMGRVFAMLWAEATSETMARRHGGSENTAITIGRFGQNVFSQIRRFVVVQVNREAHFVYALAISTYGGQGVTKPGCNASEHAVVHLTGTEPMPYQAELDKGMTKQPIMVDPTEPIEVMARTSRLRCGKIYSIEWNVKVRDIGMVATHHRGLLMRYFREEQNLNFDTEDGEDDEVDEEDIGDNA